jgi:hypothetical protein
LTISQQREVAGHLRPPVTQHPWPAEVSSGPLGGWGAGRRIEIDRAELTPVVEVEADTAHEHRRGGM